MTIDWDQFNDGDEVAVTYVGKWHKSYLDNHQVVSTSGQLKLAVDAYRIEPEHQLGEMVRTPSGAIWQCYAKHDWRLIADEQGRPPRLMPSITDIPSPSVRVKVVDA